MCLLVVLVVQSVEFRFIQLDSALEVWMEATLGVVQLSGGGSHCPLLSAYFPPLDSINEDFHKTPSLSSHLFHLLHSFLPEFSKSRAYLELTTASRHWTLAFQSEFLISPQAWR